jgi:Fibronectin type III domain/Putative binding domain, N-terminal
MIVNRVTSEANSASTFGFLILTFSLLACITSGLLLHKEAFGGQATLAWDPESASGLAGYRVHYGTVSKNYSSALDAGNQTTATITGLTAGATYYFAATAYNTAGTESAFSNEATYTVPSSCSSAITPGSASLTAAGGTRSVTVTTQSTCSWTTANPASWVTITSGAAGTGNGTVKYSVSANTTSGPRTAAMTVAGAIFSVTQGGPTYMINASAGSGGFISPSGSISVNGGGSQTFIVTSNSGYTVQSVVIDGALVGQPSSYTFSNVAANHTIQATFKQAAKAPPAPPPKKK